MDRPKLKRKQKLACINCTRRKVKCDKGRPCLACIKYRINASCIYEVDESKEDYTASRRERLRTPIEKTATPKVKKPQSIDILKMNSKASAYFMIQQFKHKIKELEEMVNMDYADGMPLNHQLSDDKLSSEKYKPDLTAEYDNDSSELILAATDFAIFDSIGNLRKFNGVNLYNSSEDTINLDEVYNKFLDNTPLKSSNDGPFSWKSLAKKDQYFSGIWSYISLNEKLTNSMNKVLFLGIANQKRGRGTLKTSSDKFYYTSLEGEGYNDIRPYGDLNQCQNVASNLRKENVKSISDNTASINDLLVNFFQLTSIGSKFVAEIHLIKFITEIIPKKEIIWSHLERFFDQLYPFMPFIDEEEFNSHITRIIGPKDNKNNVEYDAEKGNIHEILDIKNRLDLSYIGTLFVIMRLSYVSVIQSASCKPADQYLLDTPIGPEFIKYTHLCLNQFNLCVNKNMGVLQCALFLRIYDSYAPEGGEGIDGKNIVLNGLLLRMAFLIGLNREPSANCKSMLNPNIQHLKRKIWYYLIFSEIEDAFKSGFPPSINKHNYDTILPFIGSNSNIANVKVEVTICNLFKYKFKYYEILLRLLNLSLGIKNNLFVSDLANILNLLELSIIDDHSELLFSTNNDSGDNYEEAVSMLIKTDFYLSLKNKLVSSYWHLLLNYESKNKIHLALFYFVKIINLCFDTSTWVGHKSNDIAKIFGDFSFLILNPRIILMLHMVNKLFFAIIVRVNLTIYNIQYNNELQIKSDDFGSLNVLSNIIHRCVDINIKVLCNLSRSYYYAWKVQNAQSFVSNLIAKKDFYSQTNISPTPIILSINPMKNLVSFTLEGLIKLQNTFVKTLSSNDSDKNFAKVITDTVNTARKKLGDMLMTNEEFIVFPIQKHSNDISTDSGLLYGFYDLDYNISSEIWKRRQQLEYEEILDLYHNSEFTAFGNLDTEDYAKSNESKVNESSTNIYDEGENINPKPLSESHLLSQTSLEDILSHNFNTFA